jgi:hypothetical protein
MYVVASQREENWTRVEILELRCGKNRVTMSAPEHRPEIIR